jgi:Na+/H+ antiporter NhaB
MDYYYRVTLIVLVSIVVTGLIAIPFGNPKFIDRAIILELSFVTLFALILKGYNKALYVCIPLATLIIIGNSIAAPHVNLMMTFSKPLNAIILVIGGYVLQGVLIFTSLRSILNIRSKRLTAAA